MKMKHDETIKSVFGCKREPACKDVLSVDRSRDGEIKAKWSATSKTRADSSDHVVDFHA